MIVVQLLGGLGNQLFQYAAGFSLAFRLNTELYLDIEKLKYSDKREYRLQFFPHLNASVIPTSKFTVQKINIFNFLNSLRAQKKLTWFSEPDFGYCPELFECRKQTYLSGYWQSYKYFKGVEKELKECLRFPQLEQPQLLDSLQVINSTTQSVCIHIRRGDYVENPHTNQVHGILPVEYYAKAIQMIRDSLNSPSFFIFSDDPKWLREQAIFKGMNIISNTKNKDWEEMYLMSQCSHHIIANSSFSWWGAWLAENPDQIVIAPKKWFNDESFERTDKIPDDWIRI